MLHMIGFVIFGFVVGLIARALMPGRDRMSIPMTMLLGVIGALAAGWAGRAFGWYGPDDGAGFIMSTIGAIAMLAIYNVVVRKRSSKIAKSGSDREFPRKVA